MAWWYLLAAGVFEMGFAISMKLMDGHRNIPWTIAFYICIILSFGFLEQAARSIPIGTAYAVWTGIGGVGVATIGMLYLGDPATPLRIIFLVLLIVSLVGLKFTAGH
jgi:multidrug transporter EmrE-like cation transporter